MTKKWIIGIIALLIVGGILLYMFFGRSNNTPESDYTPSRISSNTTLAENTESGNNSNSTNNSDWQMK